MNNSMKNFIANCAVALGGLIVTIGCFMPYICVTVFGTTESKAMLPGDGIYFIGLAGTCVVFAFQNKTKASLIFAVLLGVLLVFERANESRIMSDLGKLKDLYHHGTGYYMIIAGTIIVVISAVVKFVIEKQSRSTGMYM